jgi:Transposase DNA-binding/Transposase Tn5 dimerisation domain
VNEEVIEGKVSLNQMRKQTMQSWAAQELKGANLGDQRLNRRLVKIVEALYEQPEASLPQACGSWAATKAAYNFFSSKQVSPQEILEAHQPFWREKLTTESIVLAIQDTSDFNFTHHRSKTFAKGFGLTGTQSYVRGLKVHSILGVSVEGVPWGLLHQQVWTRNPAHRGQAKQRRQRPIEEKESKRWLSGLVAAELGIAPSTTVVTVADREADIYELFALERASHSHFLIRGSQNRRVLEETRYLRQSLEQADPAGEFQLEVTPTPQNPARTATLTVRWAHLHILPPRNHPQRASFSPVPLNGILVTEENPPAHAEAIEWLLLTTLPVESFEEALLYVRWYSFRWLIERYHYVLKSGCRIEQLQLETADRIERALATYTLVAIRLLRLTYHARVHPHTPADHFFETIEWQSLYCRIHNTPIPPTTPPTLGQVVRWLASLGGFLARHADGEPGVKTLWRGLRRLHDISQTWRLSHP